MKKIWKYLWMLMLVATLPSVSAEASAETQTGKITIHKFELPNGVEQGDVGTGMSEDEVPSGAKELAGITFEVVRVADDTTAVEGAQPAEGAETYSETTDEEGLAVFDNLEYGIYMITELPNALVEAPVKAFLVRVPMTNPEGSGLIHDIHVFPKNKLLAEELEIDKTVTDTDLKNTSAKIGQEIDWYITIQMPEKIGAAKQFDIVDNIGELMDYEEGDVSVSLIPAEGQAKPVAGENYTVTTGNDKITISFTAEGIELLGQSAGDELQIILTTKLNAAAAGHLGEEIHNGAHVVYKNAVDRTFTKPVVQEPYVITGGIKIQKVDEDKKPLAGAVFEIYESEQKALEGKDPINNPADGQKSITTDNEGEAAFAGLDYRDYWIVETQAPKAADGSYYNLPAKPFPIKLEEGKEVRELEVTNTQDGGPDFALPVTGGRGTLILTLIGVALVGVAIWLFMISRRRNQEQIDEE